MYIFEGWRGLNLYITKSYDTIAAILSCFIITAAHPSPTIMTAASHSVSSTVFSGNENSYTFCYIIIGRPNAFFTKFWTKMHSKIYYCNYISQQSINFVSSSLC